jgi:mannosyltransferase OCH1-like enzyme
MIPKVLHFSVQNPLSEQAQANKQTWERFHPDWSLHHWDPSSCPSPIEYKSIFDTLDTSQKEGMLRLFHLYELGGLFVDLEFECLKPIDTLLHGSHILVAQEDLYHLSFDLFATVPKNPLILHLLKIFCQDYKAHPVSYEKLGPIFFTRHLRLDDRVRVCPPQMFHPFAYGQSHSNTERLSEAFTIRHWGPSLLPHKLQDLQKKGLSLRRILDAKLAFMFQKGWSQSKDDGQWFHPVYGKQTFVEAWELENRSEPLN